MENEYDRTGNDWGSITGFARGKTDFGNWWPWSWKWGRFNLCGGICHGRKCEHDGYIGERANLYADEQRHDGEAATESDGRGKHG